MEVLGATPTRNLALELARVTEAAAMMAGRFMGRGDKEGADQAAVNAMRLILSTVDMNGVIVIGEGEKDKAPMLYNGEKVGNGSKPDVDVAVDPIDGTRPLAFGRSNSLATVALAPRGTMFDPGPFLYMNKIAVGPEAKGKIDIEFNLDQEKDDFEGQGDDYRRQHHHAHCHQDGGHHHVDYQKGQEQQEADFKGTLEFGDHEGRN